LNKLPKRLKLQIGLFRGANLIDSALSYKEVTMATGIRNSETELISMFLSLLLFITSDQKSNIFFIPEQISIFCRYQNLAFRLQSGF